MAIRFELGDDEDGAVAFGYSPLLESVLSLHVLAEPKHHALQHDWVRRDARASRVAAARDRGALVPLPLDDARLPPARPQTSGYDEFDVELARLRRLRTDVVAFELLRPIYDHGGGARPRRRRILASPDVRASRAEAAATLGAASRAARPRCSSTTRAGSSSASPRSSRRTGRRRSPTEWERIEPRLAESVELAGRQIAADGIHAFLALARAAAPRRSGRHAASASTSRTTTASRSTRAEPAAARPERLRLAARARQLRRAVAARRSSTARRTSSRACAARRRRELVAAAEGARRPDAAPDPRAASRSSRGARRSSRRSSA